MFKGVGIHVRRAPPTEGVCQFLVALLLGCPQDRATQVVLKQTDPIEEKTNTLEKSQAYIED